VAILLAHFPMAYHRFALPSARVAECAHEQGRFEQMHQLLFAKQGSLGLKTWGSFALEAAIPSLDEFDACWRSRQPLPRVDRDTTLARRLGVSGTPGILADGWLWRSPPSLAVLDSMVVSHLLKLGR
jgi:protein-disulfide isomerase